MELTTSFWFVDIIIKRSNLPAMEILNSSLVDGINFVNFQIIKGPVLLKGLFSLAGPQLDSVPKQAWSNVTVFAGFFSYW